MSAVYYLDDVCESAIPRTKLDASERAAYERHVLFSARDIATEEAKETLGQVSRGLKALCFMWGGDYGVAAHRILSQIDRDGYNLWQFGLSGELRDEWYLTQLLESYGERFDYGF